MIKEAEALEGSEIEMVSGGQATPPALGLLVALPTQQVDRAKLPIGYCPGWCGPDLEDCSLSGALCPGLSPLSSVSRRKGGSWQGDPLPPPFTLSTAVWLSWAPDPGSF